MPAGTRPTNPHLNEAERIEALEAQLAKLTAVQDRKDREDAAKQELYALSTRPKARTTPEFAAYASEQQAVQARGIELRRAAHAEFSAQYDAQLERVAPECAKLERKIAQIGEQIRDLDARHAAAVQQIRAEQEAAREKITKLTTPPPMPVAAPVDERLRYDGHAGGYVFDHPQAAAPRTRS